MCCPAKYDVLPGRDNLPGNNLPRDHDVSSVAAAQQRRIARPLRRPAIICGLSAGLVRRGPRSPWPCSPWASSAVASSAASYLGHEPRLLWASFAVCLVCRGPRSPWASSAACHLGRGPRLLRASPAVGLVRRGLVYRVPSLPRPRTTRPRASLTVDTTGTLYYGFLCR